VSARAAIDRVAVVGLGLIGGSVAQVLAPNFRVVGVDTDPATCAAARADGIEVVDDVRDVAGAGALVLVAVPVTGIATVFEGLRDCRGTIVSDVASVKQPVVDAARTSALRFVGGHPMAGRELAGYEAAGDSLFSGARWALCLDPPAALADVLDVAAVVLATGAGVVPTLAAEHDRAVAVVSHLPHVLAAALAGRAAEGDGRDLAFGLVAGSFRDATRVARSPAKFWAGIAGENAPNLSGVVREMAGALDGFADAVDGHDERAVETFFARGVAGRIELEQRTADATTLTFRDADIADEASTARDELLAVGRRGGYVTHIERRDGATTIRARVPAAPEPAR
jgi:prephenate dehydrogenase